MNTLTTQGEGMEKEGKPCHTLFYQIKRVLAHPYNLPTTNPESIL